MSAMTKSEQIQFSERLDNLLKIVSDETMLAYNSNLVEGDEWGGADLIITTDPNRNRWETDTFVVVKEIKSILWLVNELRELYNEFGTSVSKYTYYPYIGESINVAIANGCDDTVSILIAMIEAARKWAFGESVFTSEVSRVYFNTAGFSASPDNLGQKTARKSRGLSDKLMEDLLDGMLSPVLQEVKDDGMTLDFQIRKNEVHIYYRGGKILGIKPNSKMDTYNFKFDRNYFQKGDAIDLPQSKVSNANQATEWVDIFPHLKRAIDRYKVRKSEGAEREFQQIVSRENTYTKTACKSDYFIVDIEYQTNLGQDSFTKFDLVGILWPALAECRDVPCAYHPKLAIFEMKYGERAFDGKSGLIEHFEKTLRFAKEGNGLSGLKTELVNIFRQKRELGLVSFPKDNHPVEVVKLSDEKPQFIMLIANHAIRMPRLRNILHDESFVEKYNSLSEYMDIRFAVASFLGYGLYESSMLTLGEFTELVAMRSK